jgi:uncharacterized protein YecE (DUF72 family)
VTCGGSCLFRLKLDVDFPRSELASDVARLAAQGVLIGTSSWKYKGWLHLLYDRDRYLKNRKFSKAKFDENCLEEYAEVFKTVCFDGGLYQFPTEKMMEKYFSQVPSDFQMSIKVTKAITGRRFTREDNPRLAGQMNPDFLNSELFLTRFLAPLKAHQAQICTLIFEFSTFKDEWEQGDQFLEALDLFLSSLPKGWNYSVEVRNRSFLRADYFALLGRYGVSHTFNNWTEMPPVGEQAVIPGSFTADFTTARFLLKPGRFYQEAVDTFSPYDSTKEPNLDARAALIDLLLTPAKPGRPNRRFLYVNNRLEGNALWTIYAAISGLLGRKIPEIPVVKPFKLQ